MVNRGGGLERRREGGEDMGRRWSIRYIMISRRKKLGRENWKESGEEYAKISLVEGNEEEEKE